LRVVARHRVATLTAFESILDSKLGSSEVGVDDAPHLLEEEVLDEVDVGDLGVVEVILDLVEVLLGQTFEVFELGRGGGTRVLFVEEHALLVSLDAEAIDVLHTGHILLDVLKLLDLLHLENIHTREGLESWKLFVASVTRLLSIALIFIVFLTALTFL
jgi:hypothetical protein